MNNLNFLTVRQARCQLLLSMCQTVIVLFKYNCCGISHCVHLYIITDVCKVCSVFMNLESSSPCPFYELSHHYTLVSMVRLVPNNLCQSQFKFTIGFWEQNFFHNNMRTVLQNTEIL
jgi:hypothetical protein